MCPIRTSLGRPPNYPGYFLSINSVATAHQIKDMGEQKHTSCYVVVNYSTDIVNKSLNGYVSNMRWHNCLGTLMPKE